jgi:predicted secreted protein
MERRCLKILNQQDHGRIISMKQGECFLLILSNPGSGGYLFQDPPEYDRDVLRLSETNRISPPQTGGGGNFGSYEWVFQAERPGTSGIVIRAARPWEKGKSQIEMFKANIEVTP